MQPAGHVAACAARPAVWPLILLEAMHFMPLALSGRKRQISTDLNQAAWQGRGLPKCWQIEWHERVQKEKRRASPEAPIH